MSTLVFFEVTHPTLPRGKDAQRLIRSHVTRVQHQKRRQNYETQHSTNITKLVRTVTDSALPGFTEGQESPVDDRSSKSLSAPASPDDTESEHTGLPFFNSSHPSQIKSSRVRKLVRSHVTRWQHRQRRQESAEAIQCCELSSESSQDTPAFEVTLPRLPVDSSERLISKGAAAIRNVILDDSSNTVATAITRLGLDLKSILAHYYYMAAEVHAPEFEAHYDQRGICRRVFLPFLFTDPALTCAIILIAIIHRMSLMGMQHPPPEILHLKGFVIMAINNALEDPTRSCSDQLIFAVANLAIFEAVFGAAEVYHVHMHGLMRMLRLRGGLAELGFDGYLQRVLLWYDSNCANLIGCDPYFAEWDSIDQEDGMMPDPGNFTVGLATK